LTFFTDRSFTKHPDYDAVVEALGPIARDLGYDGVDAGYRGGGVLHALWLLESGPGCYFKFPKAEPGGGSIWDFAATACIYRELGLPVSAINGETLPLNQPDTTYMHHCGISYATNEKISQEVRKLHQRFCEK
jgi:3'(2'), 5'-bisphosphate nucleotidase/myo-inositol-1(or 4)-monophosphatase